MLAQRLSIVALLLLAGNTALGQTVNFTCPKPGTVEERGTYKSQFTGASPTDPYTCTLIDNLNKPQSRIFNTYLVSESNNDAVRPAMLELLSGRKTMVNFDYITPNRYLYHETWTFLRREPLTINGKTLDTLVYDQETMQANGAASHGHYIRWLDPKMGLWVKGQYTHIGGNLTGGARSWTDTAITVP